MRTSALPTFRKLYGRIYVDLKENDTITVNLLNNYNTYSFGGKKKLVLSTATWLGGKNEFLGYAYLIVGGLCIFLAFAFTLLYFMKPRLVYAHFILPSPSLVELEVVLRHWLFRLLEQISCFTTFGSFIERTSNIFLLNFGLVLGNQLFQFTSHSSLLIQLL
jgi:hypothetical protein